MAGVARACRYLHAVQWWTDFWTWVNENQFAATVIGGLIVVAIVGVFSRLPKIGPHVRTFLKWLWSWHPISARKHYRDIALVHEATLAEAAAEARVIAEKAIDVSAELEKAKKELSRIIVENKIKIDTEANVRDKVRGSVTAPATPPNLPAPDPRWRIYLPDGEEFVHVLENTVERSVAKEVRLESDAFEFLDGAHWEDLSGKSKGDFSGRSKQSQPDWQTTTQFIVTWFNENNVKNSEVVYLDTSKWVPF